MSDALVSQVDLLASFAGFLNVEIPEVNAVDSRDYWSTFIGKDKEGTTFILEQANTKEKGIALRKGHMKYINFGDDYFELYDLENDPSEENNILEEQPELAEELHRDLQKLMGTPLRKFTEHRNGN